jgi:hypothetical protein
MQATATIRKKMLDELGVLGVLAVASDPRVSLLE